MTFEEYTVIIFGLLIFVMPLIMGWLHISERKRIVMTYEKEREKLHEWIGVLQANHQVELERLISKFFIKTAQEYLQTLTTQQKVMNYIHEPIAQSMRDEQEIDEESEKVKEALKQILQEEEEVIQRD